MDETPAPASNPGRWRSCLFWAGGAVGLVVLGAAGAFWGWRRHEAEVLAARATEAAAELAPVTTALDAAQARNAGQPVDLDRTVRAIHEMDLAMQQTGSLRDYLRYVATQDYRGVAPEVLESRKELLAVLMQLEALQTEEADQEEAWKVSSETVLALASVVDVGGKVDAAGVVPTGGAAHVGVDRDQAKALLAQIEQRRETRLKLKKDLDSVQNQLVGVALDNSELWHTWLERWDELCVVRDRAYLAAASQDWPQAYAAAREAIAQAPDEREAHLLAAMAKLEGGPTIDPEGPSVDELLQDYLSDHPDATAPAQVLRGVELAKAGKLEEAKLQFQQASAYYPRQAESLTDMLDPYKSRSYLRKSREGGYIVQLYQSTMDGAGYFSPDLQLARLYFQSGDTEAGRQKVLDHFQRRRTQAEWSFILDDLKFAEAWLGKDFTAMLPEASFLDLTVDPALLGDKLQLAVVNHSDRTLHNATLLLALHMTDMHPGDYDVIKAGETQAAVLAHDTTPYGAVPVEVDVFGTKKGVKDVVEHRAILISDEAVSWVDTEVYKIAEADAFRKAAAATPTDGATTARVRDAIARSAQMHWTSSLGKDTIEVTLPREVSLLAPTFRLKVGDTVLTPTSKDLGDDGVTLRFENVFNFDDADAARPDLALLVAGPGANLELKWTPGAGFDYALRGTGG